jgi:hypothetical protein
MVIAVAELVALSSKPSITPVTVPGAVPGNGSSGRMELLVKEKLKVNA